MNEEQEQEQDSAIQTKYQKHHCPKVNDLLEVIITHNREGLLQHYDGEMAIEYGAPFRYCPWCGIDLLIPNPKYKVPRKNAN